MELDNKTKLGKIERRTVTHKVELRMEGEGDEAAAVVEGYAAKFNEESELLGYDWVEVIEEGAFDGVLEDDVRCLFNHDSNLVLARNKAGTLTLEVDSVGLKYRYTTPNITYAQDLAENIRLGNVNQSSFGFIAEETKWEKIETEDNFVKYVRKIVKVKQLFDVSPVTYPAYSTTEVSVRSFDEFKGKDTQKPTEKTKAEKYRERQLYLLSLS